MLRLYYVKFYILKILFKIQRILIHIYSLRKIYPKKVQCNICKWSGQCFDSDYWHQYVICPKCGSSVRHRLLIAALSNLDNFSFEKIIINKKVLHFAPEPWISKILQNYTKNYTTADLIRPDVDLNIDITNLHKIFSTEFDVVIACDVLEHVVDDNQAIVELYRILKQNGYAIITVPQKDNLSKTYEDKNVHTPTERKIKYGQEDHLRIYGDNFPMLLESKGFDVTTISADTFSVDMKQKNVLFPPIFSNRDLATNYRKVFFARKK